MTTKLKILDAIPRGQFLGYVIAMLIAFLTNMGKLNGDWTTFVFLEFPDPLWDFLLGFLANWAIITLVVMLGIERPGINHFITELMKALRDGKLSPEEKLHLINLIKDEFLGQWADLTTNVYENVEKKEPADKLIYEE